MLLTILSIQKGYSVCLINKSMQVQVLPLPLKIIKNLKDWFESNMGCILTGDRINHFYSMLPLTAGRFGFLII